MESKLVYKIRIPEDLIPGIGVVNYSRRCYQEMEEKQIEVGGRDDLEVLDREVRLLFYNSAIILVVAGLELLLK